jgi:hypothetical protein
MARVVEKTFIEQLIVRIAPHSNFNRLYPALIEVISTQRNLKTASLLIYLSDLPSASRQRKQYTVFLHKLVSLFEHAIFNHFNNLPRYSIVFPDVALFDYMRQMFADNYGPYTWSAFLKYSENIYFQSIPIKTLPYLNNFTQLQKHLALMLAPSSQSGLVAYLQEALFWVNKCWLAYDPAENLDYQQMNLGLRANLPGMIDPCIKAKTLQFCPVNCGWFCLWEDGTCTGCSRYKTLTNQSLKLTKQWTIDTMVRHQREDWEFIQCPL